MDEMAEGGFGQLKHRQVSAGSEACIISINLQIKGKCQMKTVVTVISILVFLAGLVWFLQGINVLPGSFMAGDPQWAINGAIAMVIGGGLFWFARRKR